MRTISVRIEFDSLVEDGSYDAVETCRLTVPDDVSEIEVAKIFKKAHEDKACSHLLCRFCEDPALDGTCTCKCYQPEKSAASDKKNKNICNTLTCNSCICKNCNAEYCPRYDCNQCRNMFPHTVEPQFFCSGQK